MLSGFEAAVGMVFGLEPGVPGIVPIRQDPIEALGDVLEPHLASGHCLIWQTGDDGGALALACGVRRARREGLPDPIPMTLATKPDAPDDEHVRAVVEALGVRDWLRVDASGKLGLLGVHAREGLLRHGVRYPSIGHVVVPTAQAADGGTILDCHGLREVWDFWRGAGARRLARAGRPSRRAVVRAGLALAPRPVWRRVVRARVRSLELEHVRPHVLAWLRECFVEERVTMPVTASNAVLRLYQRRCLWETARTFGSLGADHGARVVHFFMDPAVVAALAGTAGRRGWPSSGAMLAELVPEIPARPTPPPGVRSEAFWDGPETQDFIRQWDGAGVDETLVDPLAVRDAWRRRDVRAGMLLQAAWLASGAAARERASAAPVPAAD